MSSQTSVSQVIDNCLKDASIETNIKEALKKSLLINIDGQINTIQLRERLAILFEYEKNYLDLIKTYKEEIKFVSSLQEDIRKERAKFFSETLSEVAKSLKESEVEHSAANRWIIELVNSYTKSLDVSERLVEEHTYDSIGTIRTDAKNELSKLKPHESQDS